MDEEIRMWALEIEHYQEQIIRRLEMINDKIKKKNVHEKEREDHHSFVVNGYDN